LPRGGGYTGWAPILPLPLCLVKVKRWCFFVNFRLGPDTGKAGPMKDMGVIFFG